MKLAEALRDHPEINRSLWLQALISVKLIRQDMQFLPIPDLPLAAPHDFLPKEIFENAKAKAGIEVKVYMLEINLIHTRKHGNIKEYVTPFQIA